MWRTWIYQLLDEFQLNFLIFCSNCRRNVELAAAVIEEHLHYTVTDILRWNMKCAVSPILICLCIGGGTQSSTVDTCRPSLCQGISRPFWPMMHEVQDSCLTLTTTEGAQRVWRRWSVIQKTCFLHPCTYVLKAVYVTWTVRQHFLHKNSLNTKFWIEKFKCLKFVLGACIASRKVFKC